MENKKNRKMKVLCISLFVLIFSTISSGQSCGSAVWCEGFESQTGPSVSGDLVEQFPGCKGKSNATIDTSIYHSGKKSLRIDGAAGWCDHIWVTTTKSLTSIGKIWYARVYLRVSQGLPLQHTTFIAMKDHNDGDTDLRFGGIWEHLVWNRASDDAGVPTKIELSATLTPLKWQCIEFMINGNTGVSQTWLDGKEVAGLHIGNKTVDIDQNFSTSKTWRPTLQDFRIGWESYGDGTDILWFDDVALGASRINC